MLKQNYHFFLSEDAEIFQYIGGQAVKRDATFQYNYGRTHSQWLTAT